MRRRSSPTHSIIRRLTRSFSPLSSVVPLLSIHSGISPAGLDLRESGTPPPGMAGRHAAKLPIADMIQADMAQTPTSGIPLFRLFGIQVYLHWSWLLIAVIEIENRQGAYTSIGWNIAEYVALFGIVLTHEFGHALACRSVGGQADRIMLWPLGGIAYVNPPPRAGAMLWSIAAGPLVNVILVPVMLGVSLVMRSMGVSNPDVLHFVRILSIINLGLLIFNMLPIYPLDGGQILRSLLWFFIGQRKSLMVASVIGLGGACLGIGLSMWAQDMWLIIMSAFAAMQSWAGFQRSRAMQAGAPVRLRAEARCPKCGVSPPVAPIWMCACGKPFDVFESRGTCPNCGGVFAAFPCPSCGTITPPQFWYAPPVVTPAPST